MWWLSPTRGPLSLRRCHRCSPGLASSCVCRVFCFLLPCWCDKHFASKHFASWQLIVSSCMQNKQAKSRKTPKAESGAFCMPSALTLVAFVSLVVACPQMDLCAQECMNRSVHSRIPSCTPTQVELFMHTWSHPYTAVHTDLSSHAHANASVHAYMALSLRDDACRPIPTPPSPLAAWHQQ